LSEDEASRTRCGCGCAEDACGAGGLERWGARAYVLFFSSVADEDERESDCCQLKAVWRVPPFLRTASSCERERASRVVFGVCGSCGCVPCNEEESH